MCRSVYICVLCVGVGVCRSVCRCVWVCLHGVWVCVGVCSVGVCVCVGVCGCV